MPHSAVSLSNFIACFNFLLNLVFFPLLRITLVFFQIYLGSLLKCVFHEPQLLLSLFNNMSDSEHILRVSKKVCLQRDAGFAEVHLFEPTLYLHWAPFGVFSLKRVFDHKKHVKNISLIVLTLGPTNRHELMNVLPMWELLMEFRESLQAWVITTSRSSLFF